VRYVLEALEAAGEARHLAAHRIEHIETIPDELVARFAELGVAASMQPIHGTHHTRADRSDNWSVRLGEERSARGWRCRDLREAGVTVALGSDWPITPYDPRAMMADSILRRPVERPGTAPVQPEQALTALMALEGYTTHAAAAAGLSAVTGSITPGKRADFTVFARDPLTVDPEELARTAVVATLLDGVPVV
jgi:predicted amidohydrolase YtcJ